MKRIITLIVCMVVLTMTASAVSTAKVLLQHNGSCSIYDPEAIETAMRNAVDGDTIFLTEGSFPGFTVSKKITVRGTGTGTKIKDAVKISISGTPTLTQTVLEGLDLGTKNITLTTAMNGVKIKQCRLYTLMTDAKNNDIIIDRCNITNDLHYSDNIKGMTVINSDVVVGRINGIPDNHWPIDFINCYIKFARVDCYAATFINCIVNGSGYGSRTKYYHCNFINTFLCGSYYSVDSYVDSATCVAQNCYEMYDSTNLDVSTLENKGFLGNDGTVVGQYGGVTPYTLELAVPKVTSTYIALDAENKVLNVSLKVSAN